MPDIQTTVTPVAAPTPAPVPSTIADVIASAEAKAEGQTPPAPKATPAAAPAIDIDPTTLKQITKLQREKRDLADRLKKVETASDPDTANAIEAAKLFKEGKKLEAIAKFTGKDPDSELLDLLNSYIAHPNEDAEADLAKKVDQIAKEVEADKRARADEIAAREAEKDKQAISAGLQFATRQMDPEKFELCAKAENKAEAAQNALDAVAYMTNTRKLDLETMSEAETSALFAEAFAAIEVQYEEYGKRFIRAPKRQSEDDSWTPPTRTAPPGISIAPPRKVSSLDDIIARAEERAAHA